MGKRYSKKKSYYERGLAYEKNRDVKEKAWGLSSIMGRTDGSVYS